MRSLFEITVWHFYTASNFMTYISPPDLMVTGLELNLDFFFACSNIVYGIPAANDAFEIDSYVLNSLPSSIVTS